MGEEAEKWFRALYEDAGERIRLGQWNYPRATLEIMDAALTYSGITAPVMVIAFAPPYYPAFHSDLPARQDRAGELPLWNAAKGSGGDLRHPAGKAQLLLRYLGLKLLCGAGYGGA